MSDRDKLLENLRWMTGELRRVRRRVVELEEAASEPIAIIGMACRYPGDVTSPEDLRALVERGGDAIGPFPTDRGWDLDGLYDAVPEAPASARAHEGGFVHDADRFDPGFFRISPREAQAMDPQQRLLLQTTWEAFERAAIDPATLHGSDTGVFVGASHADYASADGSVVPEVAPFVVNGNSEAVLSGRVAYTFGLEGPATTVDTACSSSLVALHSAVRALRERECGLAVVGGVTIMATPELFVEFARQRGLAGDGRCKSFADAADGTGWGEGVGVLLVERLSDARRHGHRVLALVRGSAINQDGASNGLTAPNGPSQQRVIRAAWDDAGLGGGDVDVVEAHGTGTTLGDPIEAQALMATYGADRSPGRPLLLGSVKSNLGHTQAAAGIAGVIKMVMALAAPTVPATLGVDAPSRHIDWEDGGVELLREATAWPVLDRPRRAAVSSFGISGTNAHVVLEAAPEDTGAADDDVPPADPPLVALTGPLAWPLSAASPGALAAQAARLADRCDPDGQGAPDAHAVGRSLATTRATLEHRVVVVGDDVRDLHAGLLALAAGEPWAGAVTGSRLDTGGAPRAVLVFPGQGSQWVGMACALWDASPVFAQRMAECAAALDGLVDWELRAVLADETALERVEVVQPALWAVMVSLAGLWRACGVEPVAVVGHSQGEIAAAVVAGALSVADGARVVVARSRLVAATAGTGGMVSVGLGERDVTDRLGPGLSVAAVNGPTSTVVSGDRTALAELVERCEAEDVRARWIPVDYASHSAQVDAVENDLREALAGLRPRAASVPMLSTVTGDWVRGEDLDAGYWFRNLRLPVRFADAVRTLAAAGARFFLEASAHPVLTYGVEDTLAGSGLEAVVLGTLRRDEHDPTRFAGALAQGWVRGLDVDWGALHPGAGTVDLPTYAFRRDRYWVERRAASDLRVAGMDATEHPVLGAAVELPGSDGHLVGGTLTPTRHPWLTDHLVEGVPVVPGTAVVEMLVRAGDEVGCPHVADLVLETPLVLPEHGGLRLQVAVGAPDERGGRPAELFARPARGAATGWTRHATALLDPEVVAPDFDLTAWPPAGAEPLAVDDLYPRFAERGLGYGPAFAGVVAAWRSGDEVLTEVVCPVEAPARYGLHPALLDAALHGSELDGRGDEAVDGVLLPFAWRGVTLHATGASRLRVRTRVGADGTLSVRAADGNGAPVATVTSLTLRPLPGGELTRARSARHDALFRVDWRPVPAAGDGDRDGATAVTLAPDVDAVLAEPGRVLHARGTASPDRAALLEAPVADGDVEGAVVATLDLLQRWLAEPDLEDVTLVLVTRGAVAVSAGEDAGDLAAAAVTGLVRSAQSEHPGRIVLVDVPPSEPVPAVILGIDDEPELAVRAGVVHAPRLAAPGTGAALVPPPAPAWALATSGTRSIEHLVLAPRPAASAPLGETEVRVAVRAAGINYRDVVVALGMVESEHGLGSEAAGVVVEVGPAVTDLAPGDRVLGMVESAFGPLAVTERALLARVPEGWSDETAAAVPIVFLTAYYGLVDLGGLAAGQRVLVHSAAGGVGMAAVQLARHLGAEVFGTASPGKWDALRELGLDDAHIASSRTLEFEERVAAATDGHGVDVVLDSLAREFVDASLRLLPRGGRFLEMGKTDRRDPERVAREHSGVAYRAFDLAEAGHARIQEILVELLRLFDEGVLRPIPVTTWDVRRARDAIRHVSRARHVGKVVLTMPPAPDPDGAVVVTGGTGTLGGAVARHLVTAHGMRHLVLVGRRGPDAPGAEEQAARLRELGATVELVACDVADRDALAAVLAGLSRPLTGVVHAAGALDDVTVAAMSPAHVRRALAAKVDGARHLHELTVGRDLAFFVLFSSAAAALGSPGQGNYAAANAALDALAQHRRTRGLPGQSLAWGLWAERSGLTAHLGDDDVERLRRGGTELLETDEALGLFDLATRIDEALLVAQPIDRGVLGDRGPAVPALLRGLVRAPARAQAGARPDDGGFAARLGAMTPADRREHVVDTVRSAAASVLGHLDAAGVAPERAFKDLGIDSLTAVELRNVLSSTTGLRLPATLVFDHPSPAVLAEHLLRELVEEPGAAGARVGVPPERVEPARDDDPVVIVGMSCRYPGDVRSPEDLWRLVTSGGDAMSDFPTDRGWDLATLFDQDPDAPGTSYTDQGGFVADAIAFDADFFGISPREALAMDPQQRLFLESSWEVLERAGIDPTSMRGQPVGVYVGAYSGGYAVNVDVPDELEGYLVTGEATSVISGRVAYTLGLEGPAISIDAACSSSLVALHAAAHGLRAGECDLAIAGGVAVMYTPGAFTEFARQRGMAPDGRSKPFAEAADGMGWGEGVGTVLLERLSSARRHGRRVLAVLRGSAVNQDGASNGLTAPNGPAQQRVIRQALAAARLDADEVGLVEGHGTGTRLGDPIEAQALLATYGRDRDPQRPLWLGSVKSNIGHTQAAAGVAGVIKVVMAMRAGLLPRSLHVDAPSSQVDWSAGAVEVLARNREWPDEGRPRRAGVSSFGISGTNAHLILEQAPPDDHGPRSLPTGPAVWPLSARGPRALQAQAANLLAVVDDAVGCPADIGWSLATTRTAFEHRAAVLGDDAASLRAGLAALAEGRLDDDVVLGTARGGKVVLVFPGQGAQWLGMAEELWAASPTFGERMDACAAALSEHVDWDLREVLSDAAALDRVQVVQPALWAVMVSLAALWRAHGVTPDAVLGHSQGEIAAATVAGALSLADGARVVALRSQALAAVAGHGAMGSIALPDDAVEALLTGGLSVAAVNGPALTVVSGAPDELADLLAACEADGVRARRIPVDYASHSPQMDAVRDRILAALDPIVPSAPAVPMLSTLTGGWVRDGELDAAYWFANLRHPVRYRDAVEQLAGQGHRAFLEVSPHPVLVAGTEDTLLAVEGGRDPGADAGGDIADRGAVVLHTLLRDQGGLRRFRAAVAAAAVHGVDPDWSVVLGPASVVDLPTYAFQRVPYWIPPTPRSAPDADDAGLWSAVEGGDPVALAAALGLPGPERERTPGELLEALGTWRSARRTRTAGDGWRYTVGWEPLADLETAASGSTLLLVPRGSAEHPLVRGLAARLGGVETLEVTGGACREDLVALLVGRTPDRVVSMLGAFHREGAPHADDQGAVLVTVALVQALGDVGVTAPLHVVTRGAVALPGERLADPEAAMLWGLGRTVGLEHPDRWGGLIDLPADPPADPAPDVLSRAVASLHDTEDQVAVRATGRFGRRLRPAARGADRDPLGLAHGTVLITGGTGALAAHAARWLVGRGARHLLLVGRRGGAAPGVAELVGELGTAGATAEVVACDVADRAALATLLAAVPPERPLVAVVHTAGVIDDGVLDGLTPDRIRPVLRPKVDAVRHLDELTRDHDLTAFVLYSSFAGTIGSAGQAAYAAANAHVDAVAERRRHDGLPATSVAWGVWAGTGLAVETAARRDTLAGAGFRPMDPSAATATLGDVLGAPDACVAVADVDWARLTRVEGTRPLLADVTPASPAPGAAIPAPLAGVPAGGLRRALAGLVRETTAGVLGRDVADVADHRPFRDLGFDSLTALEMRNRVGAATGLRLPTTVVFEHPTVDALVTHLFEQLDATARVPSTDLAPPVSGAVDDDPIAIVGMACRFPGEVTSPEDLWELVCSGVDAMGPYPTDRGWRVEVDPDADRGGTTYVTEGGFLHDATRFDASFFGISPREALAMDPQQRLVLESVWEVLERAGIDPSTLRGTDVGVFTGSNGQDYRESVGAGAEDSEGYLLTGNSASVLSGRVSYVFGFEGPAMTVDTACSSSLVALHLAARSLRTGECSMALAGGVSIMSTPGAFVEFARQRGLAADGRCKAFAEAADGTGWGEGVGMLLLEPLSRARERGHRVLALLRGSAVNQDGVSNGLTAPNGRAQERVIAAALSDAGLATRDVDVVEGHGTGTRLGDPIEAQALLATYGRDRDPQRPLWLGSVKSNIGHTQAAAGVAGVIKVVMAMRAGLLPRSLHVDAPSSQVDWSAGAVEVLARNREWPDEGRPRRAGVSSFGISGTNAHVVVEAGPDAPPVADADADAVELTTPVPVVLSAASDSALRDQARRLAERIERSPGLGVAEVARSCATARAGLDQRAAVVARDRGELLAGLGRVVRGEGESRERGRGGLAVMFTGQGAQRVGMGRDLAAAFPVFAAELDRACTALEVHLPGPVRGFLLAGADPDVTDGPDPDVLDRTEWAQPALFAFEVALFRLVESWGIVPDVVMGHSLGEIVAAHVAGVLSLEDASALVAARARLMGDLPGGGAMLAVDADEAEVLARLGAWPQVAVAAVNGPSSVVVSGPVAHVDEVEEGFRVDGRRTRRLRVSHAFHSPSMDPVLAPFARALADLEFRAPRIPVVSNVTGTEAGPELAGADYWVRHVREAVRFGAGVASMAGHGVDVLLELGPDAALSASAGLATDATVIAAQHRDRSEVETLVDALGRLWCAGIVPDWDAVLPAAAHADLPTYPFEHRHYWLAPTSRPADAAGHVPLTHPSLHTALPLVGTDGRVLTGRLAPAAYAAFAPGGAVAATSETALPAVAWLDVVAAAAAQVGCDEVSTVAPEAALVLPGTATVELQVEIGAPDAEGARAVAVHTRTDPGSGWTRHVSTIVRPGQPEKSAPTPTGPVVTAASPLAAPDHDDAVPIATVSLEGDVVLAELPTAVPERAGEGWALDPASIESLLRAGAELLEEPEPDHVLVPHAFAAVRLPAHAGRVRRARLAATGPRTVTVTLLDDVTVVGTIGEVDFRAVPVGASRRGTAGALHRIDLVRSALPSPTVSGRWSVVGPDALGVEAALRAAGVEVSGVDDLGVAVADAEGPPSVLAVPMGSGADATEVGAELDRLTAILRSWAADERWVTTTLVVITRAATSPGSPDLAAAATQGLVRAAQAEEPGRIVLVDLDVAEGAPVPPGLPAAASAGHAELVLRPGAMHLPRLVPAAAAPGAVGPDWARGAVLVTGGTSGIGAAVARHLVVVHGVRHLLLLSRRGPDAPQAQALRSELVAHGADVDVVACDVADRDAVATAIARVPAEHPLRAVVHAAGAVPDGTVASMGVEHLEQALRPKLGGALVLDELTRTLDLEAFVVFSAAAGLLGSAGQGAYAAANTALDALVRRRRAGGLPGQSLAWGLWEIGMAARLDDVDRTRLRRSGVRVMDVERGLALLDAATAVDAALVAPVDLDPTAWRSGRATVPELLRELVGEPAGRPTEVGETAAADLAVAVAAAPEGERGRILLDGVRSAAAAVLGLAGRGEVGTRRGFTELGFDSLMAVELRNRLSRSVGVPLPATVLFDHPSPEALAAELLGRLTTASAGAAPSGSDGLASIAAAVDAGTLGRAERRALVGRLQDLLHRLEDREGDDVAGRLAEASDDDLFDFIDELDLSRGNGDQ